MKDATVIGVLTYQRPDELRRLLGMLISQVTSCAEDVSVVVIDNDPAESSRAAVSSFDSPLIRYVSEPHPGIAAARNRALDVARDARTLIFIDDDETPSDEWLTRMLDARRRFPGACIVGPVIPSFDAPVDSWIEAGAFFIRKRHSTGTRVQAAGTGNLLLPVDRLREVALIFDERFGLSGGSDTLFTRSLVQRGIELVWCDEAPIYDHVPQGRVSRRWVLQRALRSGNSWSRSTVVLAPAGVARLWARLQLVGGGCLRVVGGGLRAALGYVTRSPERQARAARTAARGIGFITGALGYVYTEYRRSATADAIAGKSRTDSGG